MDKYNDMFVSVINGDKESVASMVNDILSQKAVIALNNINPMNQVSEEETIEE